MEKQAELLALLMDKGMGFNLFYGVSQHDDNPLIVRVCLWYLGMPYAEHGLVSEAVINDETDYFEALEEACQDAIQFLNSKSFKDNYENNPNYIKKL